MNQGFRNLFGAVRTTGVNTFQQLRGTGVGTIAALTVGAREFFQTLTAASNLRKLQIRDEVELATLQFQSYERWRKAREEGQREAIRQQLEYNRTIQQSIFQFQTLRGEIQNLFSAVNQGTRSGGQGVSGFGSGFIQFTNTLIALGETVANVSGSRLFHNPANDRLAEIAGFRVGSAGAIRAASRQSALDFSNSFGRGFERAQRASAGPVDNRPIEVRVPLIVNNKTTQEVVRTINRLEQSHRTRVRR